MTLNFRLPSTW